MAIELVHLCDVDVVIREPLFVGEGPAGLRVVGEVESATATGERLRASLAGPAAADWLVIHGTVGTIDVRATMRTDDGALVYAQYHGRMDVSGGVGTAPVFVAPRFETGDERYAWLNTVQAIGKGTFADLTHLHYEWYEAR